MCSVLAGEGSDCPIMPIDPLDVVSERGVGHQRLVAVYVVHSKLEGQLIHTHQLTLSGLKYSTYRDQRKENHVQIVLQLYETLKKKHKI